ncbi:MAG: sugar ABC transporter substrate-binding protein [Rhodobacteraceae bacterium]|nr:sugar ABC transporter substrate-binding protein [Paracoccaceae bacterium]
MTDLTRRRFMQHGSAVALSAAGLAAGLSARTALASGHVSGDITMIKGPHSADEARFEAMIIDDFKAVEPGVNVTFTTYDWANMNAELTTGFASGNPSDVLYLVDLIYPNYAQQGALHDMTALVGAEDWSSERAQIPEFAWDLARLDGGTWGVPVLGAVYNIYVNKDLLSAAGVLDTWNRSYADMMDAARKTTSDGVYGFSVRARTGDFAFWDWLPYVHNAGADLLSEDWSECGLRGAEDATQFLIDMHQAGVTPPIGAMSTQEQFDLFKAGKIAIHHGETPQIAALMADPPAFEWDVAYAPPGETAQTVMGNFGILSIAEASPNKEAAWEFIKHWASGPQVGRFAEQVNLQVVREDIVDGMFDGNPAMQKIQQEFVPRVVGIQPHPQILKILQSIWPVAEQAYRGEFTGQETIDQMCDIINQIIA